MIQTCSAAIGLGYLVPLDQMAIMLDHAERCGHREEVEDAFHSFGNYHGKRFFGDIIVEIPIGKYHSFEELNHFFSLFDTEAFGEEYGRLLTYCGLSIEEINEKWNEPEFYFLCMETHV